MNCAFVVQTCDKYEPFWEGFFYYLNRHWDFNIKISYYFCNEEKTFDLPSEFKQIKTGKGTFVQNLNKILQEVKEDNIFYMLEDFWINAPMNKNLFESLFNVFLNKDLDALQVSSYLPYYKLKVSNSTVMDKSLLDFEKDSEWIFNFQARFWKKEIFKKCLVEPDVSEDKINSAISVEIKSDQFVRKKFFLNVLLFHYFWYPISGVAYRGKLTEIGKQMQNIIEIDKHVEKLF